MQTQNLTSDQIETAAKLLSVGGLVALPTETVYGLAADARNGIAVAAIYAAKARPNFNPLIVHVASLDEAKKYADFNETALALAAAFWPGPLSMVLPLRTDAGLSELVTAGLDTVAIRVPAHPVAHALLERFGGPLAAPSANISGQVSPTTAGHVHEELAGDIHAILDGGASQVGLESTIVMPRTDAVVLMRAGGISLEQLGMATVLPIIQAGDNTDAPQSPGQLASHYATRATLRINATSVDPSEAFLGFGPECADADLNLSQTGDLKQAAANLFAYMREMDDIARTAGKTKIAVAPIPDEGLGLAINDRLKRAAAPRT